jgi:hypothetical protein
MFRRHDPDFPRDRCSNLGKHGKPWRIDTIIIGQQYAFDGKS